MRGDALNGGELQVECSRWGNGLLADCWCSLLERESEREIERDREREREEERERRREREREGGRERQRESAAEEVLR